jgi:hypothetical protein
MTELNVAGGRVPTAEGLCMACRLAQMTELGTVVLKDQVDAGHSDCEGTTEQPCSCSCDYARHVACKECGRKGTELDHLGQCANRRDCSNTILAAFASKRQERAAARAAAPAKQRRSGGSSPRPCKCGCGEQTGGGLYRPGHDARHVSQLTKKVRAGELTLEAAVNEVRHSDALVGKLRKAVGS